MQKLLVRVSQAVKKVARAQAQHLSSKAHSSPSPSASKSFEGRVWIKGYSRATRQAQKCHGKSAELNGSHGLAQLSQFPGARIDSVSWKACGCHILSFSKEVWFSLVRHHFLQKVQKLALPSGNIYLLGYIMEGKTQRRNGPLDEEKLSSAQTGELSFQATCHEQLTGIQTAGPGDHTAGIP